MAGTYFGLLALGMALMLPLAAIGCGIGEGLVFASAIQAIARQPAVADRITTLMYICFGLVETLFIITLVFFFVVKTLLPTAAFTSLIAPGH